jgi:nitrogen fixation NifU-like protein
LTIYSEKVIEHFMCPQNAHSMPDADAEWSYGDPSCGNYLTVYLKVKDNRIEEVSYLVFGYPASIATSSMTSVLARGETLEEALNITEEDIVRALDGLREDKFHCSNLGSSALHNAINNYLEMKRTEDSYENSNSSR